MNFNHTYVRDFMDYLWFDNKEFRGAAKLIFRGTDNFYATSIFCEIAQPSSGVVF